MKKFTKQHRENLSKSAKGKKNSQWGRKWSNERKLKASARMKENPIKHWLGKKQPKEMVKKRMFFKKNYKHSKETIEKISRARRGKYRWNWKGGITPLTKQIRKSPQYKQWRSNVYQRDNWTCQTCNNRGGNLEAHHIKKFYKILKENKIKTLEEALKCKKLWDINNGVTLCKDCHELTKKGKKYD